MTKLLEKAISRVRELPDSVQDEAAEILLAIAARSAAPVKLDEQTRMNVREGLEQAKRGEFVSEAEMDAFFARHR